jgi:hypothetical protein
MHGFAFGLVVVTFEALGGICFGVQGNGVDGGSKRQAAEQDQEHNKDELQGPSSACWNQGRRNLETGIFSNELGEGAHVVLRQVLCTIVTALTGRAEIFNGWLSTCTTRARPSTVAVARGEIRHDRV